jgi:chromate transporter
MVMVWALAVAYVQTQTLPQATWLLYGIKPAIIAIVIQALWNLGKKAIKDRPTPLAAIVVIALFFIGGNEILLLIAAGVAVMLWKNWRSTRISSLWLLPLPNLVLQTNPAAPTSPPNGLNVFLIFLKIGSVLYGSGYVLLAFLQRDLVEQSQWLTSTQLLDAVAIGQFTPGPVFTTATFIGYLLAGHVGAIAATIGIFLPAFVLVAVINPWVPRLRQSRWAGGFLDGVNAASMGLMAVVTWELGRVAIVDGLTAGVTLLSLVLLLKFRVNSAWLVLAGGLLGLGVRLVG